MKDLREKIKGLTKVVRQLVSLLLEIGTLVAIAKMILESLFS